MLSAKIAQHWENNLWPASTRFDPNRLDFNCFVIQFGPCESLAKTDPNQMKKYYAISGMILSQAVVYKSPPLEVSAQYKANTADTDSL